MLNILPKQLKALSTENIRRPSRRVLLIGVIALAVLLLVFSSSGNQSVSGQDAAGLAAQSLPVLLILAFIGGVVSFVSPCTLPILPAYFAFATQSGRSRIAINTVAFMLGVATMFSLLGASASALGRLIIHRQELLLLIGGSIVIVFGVMSLLGKGFTGFSQKENTDGVQKSSGSGPGGSYAFGLTFSLGWSSCVGPILGVVLTLAASTGSVTQGMLLLFVYAIGLGLPLIIVSTFFGRASRKSLFWRTLRGKGWFVNTHILLVALIWALAIWRVLVAFTNYGFENISIFAGQSFTGLHEFGLLAIVIAAAVLWIFSSQGDRRTTLQLHSTQLFSGVLFIAMALLMLSRTLADFNSLIPPDLAIWFSGLEERLITIFS